MNKELQDLAWSVLPKEFKEEVKKEWKTANNEERLSHDAFLRGCYSTMTLLFGLHNLTSDAEGEEMLTVSRKRVQDAYLNCDRYFCYEGMLEHLFGSKCRPDEGTDCTPVEVGVAENTTTSNVDSLEPKPSEPKFKEGDIVRYRYDGKLYIVECKTGKYYYALRQPDGAVMIHDVLESDLEPYTEQEVKRHVSVKEACGILGVDKSEATKLVKSEPIETCTETCTDECSSSDHFVVKDEMVDNIIKDGFKNHNRLHIAAILAAGMLASEARCYPVDRALELADALISEAKKGGFK